jgi:NACalpha-BTF3-like transcription factor
MYKIKNIAASRSKGCLTHNPVTLDVPTFTSYGIEPYICGVQLKLYEEMNIPEDKYGLHKKYLDELVKARVIEVIAPIKEEIKVVKEVEISVKTKEIAIEEPTVEQMIEEAFNSPAAQIPEVTHEDSIKLTVDPFKKKKAKK